MFILVILILLGVAAVGLLGASVFVRNGYLAGAGVALLIIELLSFSLGGIQSVPVKSIGVPQAFGTVSGGVMGPGVHFTWQPWMSVSNVDETVQTTTFEQGSNLPGTKSCDGSLSVRIGGQQTACADATIQWQILPSAAEGLYESFANQGDLMQTVTDAVVIREFKQVVNQVLGDYNPITDQQNVAGSNTATSQFTSFGPTILADMQKDIGSRIRVTSVFLPHITYDTAVEKSLATIQQANANYAIAVENVKVAQEQSQAYVKLGDPTTNQLIAECLSIVERTGSSSLQCIPGATSNLAISGSTTSK